MALASIRLLPSQGPVSVHAHRTVGVTGSEGREGANGVGIGGGNDDGDGAGTGTRVEANEGTQDGNGGGNGNGDGGGDPWMNTTGTGAGAKTRSVAEMGTRTRTGSGRAQERRISARNRSRIVDAIKHFHSVRVSIFVATEGGACGHPTAPSARPGTCTCASHRGCNRVRGTGRSERGGSGNGNGGVGERRSAR